ncbi:MAG: hypothetical protein JXA42_16580 [Anaerolineales bacterium]|nr:hypothetical protein [Anaerolineales bacterium]
MNNNKWMNWILGLFLVGGSLTGIVGFLAALIALLYGEISSAAACLIAAGLAFGLLANAVLRE